MCSIRCLLGLLNVLPCVDILLLNKSAGEEGAVTKNLLIELALMSWKTLTEIEDDKKILNEGEGYERPTEGAVVKGMLYFDHSSSCCFCNSLADDQL